jgi:hypothetical protein
MPKAAPKPQVSKKFLLIFGSILLVLLSFVGSAYLKSYLNERQTAKATELFTPAANTAPSLSGAELWSEDKTNNFFPSDGFEDVPGQVKRSILKLAVINETNPEIAGALLKQQFINNGWQWERSDRFSYPHGGYSIGTTAYFFTSYERAQKSALYLDENLMSKISAHFAKDPRPIYGYSIRFTYTYK